MNLFMNYEWPGNIRELENVMEHSVVVARGSIIELGDLPQYLTEVQHNFELPKKDLKLEYWEKEHILKVLNLCKWNIKRAAAVLGINRVTLYNKMRRYDLKKETDVNQQR